MTAVHDHLLRAVSLSYQSAHTSIVCGLDQQDVQLDWTRPLDELIRAFTQVEPIARSAFIRYSTDPDATGSHAHDDRDLEKLANRRHLSDRDERALEESGLVDAHGIVFVGTEPDALPREWASRQFGHLRRIDAGNLAEWLSHPPSEQTLQNGRTALRGLLRQHLH